MLYPEKITELSQVTEKVHHVRTWRRTFILCAMWEALVVVPYDTLPLCQVKDTGRGTVWHIAMRNTLVVLPHGALSCCTGRGTVWRIVMLHWLWHRMTHCQVKGTGRGTVWHIAMWKALVMVPYDTLPGERHWPWYRKTHYQVKYIGCGTA